MSDLKFSRRHLLGAAAAGVAVAATGCGAPNGQNARSAGRRAPAPLRDADVIVIGAGLSGLNATLLLEEMGLSVSLIEGRDRVGGRVYTMDDVPGAPEAGGSGIGASYGRLLAACERFGVGLGPERRRTVPAPDTAMMNIRGQHIQFDDWASHPLNPMPEGFRDQLPWYIQYGLYGKSNPLANPQQFVEPQFAPHDISVYEYFKQQGFSDRAIELAVGTNMSYGDESGPHGLSTLLMYNVMAFGRASAAIKRDGSPFAGVGGNQRIPEAMATGVRQPIQFNARVAGIRSGADYAEVQLADGRRAKAKRIVVTLPFSALRLIDIDAPVPELQSRAIRRLGYTNVTHLSYVATRKFWEDDNLPASMWTDGPTARFMALRNDPSKPERITSFMAFANDRVAHLLDRLGPLEASRYVLDYLERIRPSTRGALKFVKFWSWQLDPFAGGAYAAWRPGQLSTFGAQVSQPVGRLHFAGEHTAVAARGMEGAMESGERAAFEVLNAM